MAPAKRAVRQAVPSKPRTNELNGSPGKTQSTLSKDAGGPTGKLKTVKKPVTGHKTAKSGQAAAKTSPIESSPSKLDFGSSPTTKGSIQSFFSAAPRQRKQSPETTSRTSRASTPLDLTETIDSDGEQGGLLSLSKGSSTALALRKRKSSAFSAGAEDVATSASQKFRRTDTGRVPSMALQNSDNRPWTVQFAPSSLDELAVHKKKVTDVKGWLEHALSGRHNRALILKGPAGSGKTTTLNLLAAKMGIGVLEWSNPSGRDQVDHSTSATTHFEEFVSRSGRSAGLQLIQGDLEAHNLEPKTTADPHSLERQILLVEEFPNTFSKTSIELQSFRSAIAQHLAIRNSPYPTIPLILVVSETVLSTTTAAADSFTTHRLLGPELSSHPYIDTIEFNPIAPTILHRALDAIVIKEARRSGRRTTPGPVILKRLAEFGDIRSAVATLEFLCVQGDEEGNWSARITFGKTKRKAADVPPTKLEKNALLWISSRESTLGIWHAVGKVLYNKRVTPSEPASAPPTYLSQHFRSMVAENDVNDLVNDIGTDTSTFIASLHENYLPSCTRQSAEQSLETACKCLEELSDADLLSLDQFSSGSKTYSGSATDTLRQDEMSFQLAVRGILFNLPPNLKRSLPTSGPRIDAHRMYYPAALRLWRKQDEIEAAVDALKLRLRTLMKTIARAKVDTAYSLANTVATPWTHDKDDAEARAQEEDQSRASFITLASKELLMDCLPRLAPIMQHLTDDRILLDLLKTVTSVTTTAKNAQSADETPEDDENGQKDAMTADMSSEMGSAARLRMTRKKEAAFPLSGADQQMEWLVLEDDDIVDD